MKRTINIIVCIIALSLVLHTHSAAITSDPITLKELHVEYMDFYNNQEYYEDLVANQNYIIYINIGTEYIDLERSRIQSQTVSNSQYYPDIVARGTSIPTSSFNVHKLGTKNVNGSNVNSYLYSEVTYTGCVAYTISITNLYDHRSITCDPVGNTSGPDTFTIPALHTVLANIGTGDASREFYLKFPPPAWVEGYVKCIGH